MSIGWARACLRFAAGSTPPLLTQRPSQPPLRALPSPALARCAASMGPGLICLVLVPHRSMSPRGSGPAVERSAPGPAGGVECDGTPWSRPVTQMARYVTLRVGVEGGSSIHAYLRGVTVVGGMWGKRQEPGKGREEQERPRRSDREPAHPEHRRGGCTGQGPRGSQAQPPG